MDPQDGLGNGQMVNPESPIADVMADVPTDQIEEPNI
jgi:hypothetical protein